MEYKKVFLDTCVLSDIGRMNTNDRINLAVNFVVKYKFQIIITLYHIMELERLRDEKLRNNIYDFLKSCYLGVGKNYYEVFYEELSGNKNINIVEYDLSPLNYDENGHLMDFETFKNEIIVSKTYQEAQQEYEKIGIHLQSLEKPISNTKLYTKILITENAKNRFGIADFNYSYNDIPGFYTYMYSFANKIGSSSLKDKSTEINDVCMSYLAPYMDIVVAERKQVARYNELKQQGDFNGLDKVIIKKHSDIIKYNENGISFEI